MDFSQVQAGIINLQSRYVDAVWRGDRATIASLFTEDGEWRIANQVSKGRAEIDAFFGRSLAKSRSLLVTLRNPCIAVTGPNSASGRTFFSAHNFLVDGSLYTPVGIYYERFEQDGGQWKFKWRMFQSLYSGGPDGSGELHIAPDYGPAPAMPPIDAMPTVSAQNRGISDLP